jgi:hypothetical protein
MFLSFRQSHRAIDQLYQIHRHFFQLVSGYIQIA